VIRRSVLIVDDDSHWLDVLARIVDEMGFEPLRAMAFDEAKALLSSRSVRLILVDATLNFSGFNADCEGFFEWLAAEKRHIPIIAVTGKGLSASEGFTLRRLGAVDFFLKDTLDVAQMRHRIALALNASARPDASTIPPLSLIDAVNDNTAVLFAGAGLSQDVLEVATGDVRELLAGRIRFQFPDYATDSRTFEEVCDEYEALYGRPDLLSVLGNLLAHTRRSSAGHELAVGLFRNIVTTNWDLLFEAAFATAGRQCAVIASDSHALVPSQVGAKLWKVHGTADQPSTIVCTRKDYETFHATRPVLLTNLRQLLLSSTVLFLGSGLRDLHIRTLLATIRVDANAFGRRPYVVGCYDEVRARLLESEGFHVIQSDALSFLRRLRKVLDVKSG
jgi:DNA-binding response OmpR family regulator